MITVQDVLDHLGIDYQDEMVTRNIERYIKVADSYLQGSIGTNYPRSDPRAVELALIIVNDLYDNRGMTDKVSGNVRRLVDSLSLQLRLEYKEADTNV